MYRKPIRVFALLVAFASFAGCAKVATSSDGGTAAATASARHAYTHPHEFRFAVAADIKGLNPLTGASAYEAYLAQLCMAWLIKTDAHGDATVPELITEIPSLTNGGISNDGKTLTFHIRHGVKWSDGAPFDADDVVFSTNQVNNPKNNVISRDGWDQITSLVATVGIRSSKSTNPINIRSCTISRHRTRPSRLPSSARPARTRPCSRSISSRNMPISTTSRITRYPSGSGRSNTNRGSAPTP